ncbi:hypothetical protein FOA52_006111 [Chlamydomonas sp. UWO 241]|nr:hypothetical protein FOA52_006111 [Chlamydomonas sp. UWO 241]
MQLAHARQHARRPVLRRPVLQHLLHQHHCCLVTVHSRRQQQQQLPCTGACAGTPKGDGDGGDTRLQEELAQLLRLQQAEAGSRSRGGDREACGGGDARAQEELAQLLRSQQADAGSSAGSSGTSGDADVQEALGDVLALRVEAARVRARVEADVEARRARARAIGEEILGEVRESVDADKGRAEAAAARSLASTNAAFDALDAEVEEVAADLAQMRESLDDFQDDMAARQNRFLFFGRLYNTRPQPPADAQAVARTVSAMQSRLAADVNNARRLSLFVLLAAALAAVAAQDLARPSPVYWKDAVYAAIVACMAMNVAGERAEVRVAEGQQVRRRTPFQAAPVEAEQQLARRRGRGHGDNGGRGRGRRGD